MGHNLKWDTLDDYRSRDADIYARCFRCNRTAIFSGRGLAHYFSLRGWHLGMVIVYSKLKCRRCRQPVGKVGPTRQLADTFPPDR